MPLSEGNMLLSYLRNLKWRLIDKSSSSNHVFVLGAPRSGTTLLQILIASHSKFLGCEGESGIFTRQNLFNCRRYCGLSEAEVREIQARCTNIVAFFDSLAETLTEGRYRFVEKTPQHVLCLKRLLRWFPKSQFVNIVRDGRDCYCSAQCNLDIPQRDSVIRFARYWRRCIRARDLAGNSPQITDVRYEDLVREPKERLSQLMEFLGVTLEPEQLAIDTRATDSRSSLAVFARLAEHVNEASVCRWKNEMSKEEVRKFQSIAAAELKQFGYKLK